MNRVVICTQSNESFIIIIEKVRKWEQKWDRDPNNEGNKRCRQVFVFL